MRILLGIILITSSFLLIIVHTKQDPYAEDEEVEEEKPTPSLHGDVINWADMIKNYIQQLANEAINRDYTQSLFDSATYAKEFKNGTKIVQDLQRELSAYFAARKIAAKRIADAAVAAYDQEMSSTLFTARHLKELRGRKPAIYLDSDDPKPLPERVSQGFFKQPVIANKSTVKIADEVPRDLNHTISSVKWTFELEKVMIENTNTTKDLRWQYFGTKTGVLRLFPGREWSSNFLGFYEDYDPRTRPWYISSTSGPKDVVIVLDCSMSMAGVKFGVARHLINAIITSLTKKDYMNVVCARESSWDDVGKWHPQNSQVLSCQESHLVPATSAFRKDLINKINELRPGGTTEVLDGFEKAFRLLKSTPRAGCHSILIFVTDGKDTDTDSVRCGPGYYTRSGYVPGPLCKYAWNKTWEHVGELYKSMKRTKIFSFLIQDDGEIFPGKLACDNQGGFFKLMSSQNLISNLESYFTYLAKSTPELENGIWTEPYLDNFGLGVMITYAIPAISKRDQSLIGVAGVDVTVEEIEMIFTRYQWGSVSSFLIDKEGQTIFHPLLLPNSNLRDDPVFIPINQLEQDREGSPEEFNKVLEMMTSGITGDLHISKARRGMPKGDFRAGVRYDTMPLTYYFASVNNSDYSFAIVLSETDKTFRSLVEPSDPERYSPSYFNLLIEYNSSLVRKHYPDAFDKLNMVYNDTKYPLLRVAYNHSSIMLPPQCHCDPSAYSIDDNYAMKTLRAHQYMNEHVKHMDCETGGHYERDTRAYILLSKPIEQKWKERNADLVKHVMWTYVGMRSGVFRTYPGHRSVRMYDPTSRSWYRRTMANPSKISISTPYFDLAGSGKVVTISQAVFEGKETLRNISICKSGHDKSGGCPCQDDEQCKSGRCYMSSLEDMHTCATERIEAITSLDLKYDAFHDRLFNITKVMKTNGIQFNCGAVYACTNLPDRNCTTNCYLFDNRANVIVARKFRDATALDENKYKGVTLGNIEGDIMKDLIYKHALFIREDSIDFQGVCSFSSSSVRVTMEGIPRTPQEEDDYSRKRIPIPKFQNSYGCIQDVVSFTLNTTRLNRTQMIVGNVSGPCSTGYYYVTSVRDTNLFLLVIQDSVLETKSTGINFNCIITRGVSSSGAYRILNGTCAHNDSSSKTLDENKKCPRHVEVKLNCTYNSTKRLSINLLEFIILFILSIKIVHNFCE